MKSYALAPISKLLVMALLLAPSAALAQATTPSPADKPKPADSTSTDAQKPADTTTPEVKKSTGSGGKDDVDAIGNRKVGKRGLGDWYSTESEIKLGKQYAQQVEQTVKLVQDPVVNEYVNRIGQNLVRNSDARVPFTIKVVDSDEINA